MIPSRLLVGDRVRLTALTKEDAPAVSVWYDDSFFGRLFDSVPAVPKTPAQIEKWIEQAAESQRDFLFGIRRQDDNRLLGIVELDGVQWQHGTSGIGLAIGLSVDRGKGVGTEAGQLALAFAFQELNLYRVVATVFSYNAPSVALLEKLGFVYEGSFREHLLRDGQRYDMHLYGLLRREWESPQR